MKSATKNRLSLAIAAILSVSAWQSIQAADFFPENANPITTEEMVTFRAAEVELGASADDDVLIIGDMMFRVSDLVTNGFSGRRWTNGNFYYEFDPSVSALNRQHFREGCAVWENVSAVECIERSQNEPNYVYVLNSQYNRSFVGMIGGQQTLEMFNWGWRYIIAHEIGHALGLSHEQSRSDRDAFVRILFSNIRPGTEGNFRRRATTNHTPYDFRSIMHYRSNAFSINGGPTIEPQPGYETEAQHMGNRHYLSAQDAAGMASQYGPN